jgi:hypothetical protein
MQLPRGQFVAAYGLVVVIFLVAFSSSIGLKVRAQFERNWVAGIVVGVLVGLLLMRQVRAQPDAMLIAGLPLIGQLVWFGIVYGVVDALLLSVLPVLALYGTRHESEMKRPMARLKWGAIALAGSILVTAAYHAGFSEFRGSQLVQPLIGNALITLAYLLTGSPIAPITAHVLMHVAAVLHGMAATMQLPPHY